MSFGTGPVSANTVVPWPVQPKPESKPSSSPNKETEKGADGSPQSDLRRIQGGEDRRSGQDLGGFRESGDSGLGRFHAPKDEVELPKNPGPGHREKAEAFLDRSRPRSAPIVGQKLSGQTTANDELSEQLRSNMTRSRLEQLQRRPGLR